MASDNPFPTDFEGDVLPPDSPGPVVVGPPITTEVNRVLPPDTPTDFPREQYANYYRDVMDTMRQFGAPMWVNYLVAGILMIPFSLLIVGKNLFVPILRVIVPPIAGVVLETLGTLRTSLDDEFAALSVTVLGELLGDELQASHIPGGTDFGSHLARADVVGQIFHNVLLSEFGGDAAAATIAYNPGNAGDSAAESSRIQNLILAGVGSAQRFTGLVINFATATGIIGLVGGMYPELHIDEVREIGELVAKNLGLGRMHRQAIMPIFKTLVAQPYQWNLNQKYRPTQFGLSELVNPFTQEAMDAQTIHDQMALLGYSDDKIAKLIALHQKKVDFASTFELFERGILDAGSYKLRTQQLGIPDSDIQFWELPIKWKREHTWERNVIDAAARSFREGNIERAELEAIANTYLHDPDEIALFMAAADYEVKIPRKVLTLAQITKGFELGIIDQDGIDTRLAKMGYSTDDQNFLALLILIEAKKVADAAAAKAAKSKSSSGSTSTTSGTGTTPTG